MHDLRWTRMLFSSPGFGSRLHIYERKNGIGSHREFGKQHQPVWRVSDRATANNNILVNPANDELRNITWKRNLGRLIWEYNGETYIKQYLPTMLNNLENTPEVLIREMDYIRVEKLSYISIHT